MKKLNFIQLFIINYIIAVPFVWLITYYFPHFITEDNSYPIDLLTSFKMSLAFSVIYSLLYILMIFRLRKNDKFWEQAELVRQKLKEVETKVDLDTLINDEYFILFNLAQGGQHITEIQIISAIIDTKKEYLNGK